MINRYAITAVSPGLTLGQGIELRQGLRHLWARELACVYRSAGEGASIELRVELPPEGGRTAADEIRTSIFEAEIARGFDLAFQRETVRRSRKRLLVADMDSTLIEIEVVDELARMHGVADRVAPITERAMRGELGFAEALRERVALLAGLPLAKVEELAANLPLSEGAEALVRDLRAKGCAVAVVSGGFEQGARALQERLGLDRAFANRLEVRDGRLTGGLIGEIVDGAAKARHLEAMAAALGLERDQVVAVGDGANDLAMLKRAGLGVAYRGKPILREVADAVVRTSGLDAILHFLDA